MEKKYTTLLFDADNTLLDFDTAEEKALSRVLTEIGMNVTEEVVKQYSAINLAYWQAFERGEVTKAELRTARFADLFKKREFHTDLSLSYIADTYLSYLGEGEYLLDGAIELCERLKDEGYKIYIITNGVAETQKKRLSKSGLDRFLDGLFVSETVGSQKPQAAFFEYVFEHIDEKDKEKLLVIGDSYGSDIKGACGVGLDCIWLNPKSEDNALSLPIKKEIRDLRELFGFFELN